MLADVYALRLVAGFGYIIDNNDAKHSVVLINLRVVCSMCRNCN